MKLHLLILLLFASFLSVSLVRGQKDVQNNRRILHQPLFPISSSPPPDTDSGESSSPPPPPPDGSGGNNQDQPFFPEDPNGQGNQNQNPTPPSPPPPSANGSQSIPTATQPTKPTKKVAIAISVVIVTLGMLSALLFYIYRHKVKHPKEDQKLEGVNSHSQSYADGSRAPPSSFLYIGTVDPSNEIPLPPTEDTVVAEGSPYHKFNSVKKTDRYRPSPDLQPLPPLSRQPPAAPVVRASPPRNSQAATALSSSEDEGSQDMVFYTPHGSTASYDEGFSTPVSRHSLRSNGSSRNSVRGESHGAGGSMPYSKRTSPRTRLPAPSQDVIKHAIIPSIKTTPPPQPPPPPQLPEEAPPMQASPPENNIERSLPRRAKFGAPPPPPNLALLQSISNQSCHTEEVSATTSLPPPPPPPPPPPQVVSVPPKVRSTWTNFIKRPSESASESQFPDLKVSSRQEDLDSGCSSSGRPNEVDTDRTKPRLKPLHWDKVRATSDRATVWDQMKSSSFQVNEDMIESLFGCKPNSSNNAVNNEATRRAVLPPVEQENRVLDPKKSQNIAILLRALNVTRDEVSEALLDGNSEALGAELLETLVKMAPTKEEEIKLTGYKGDTSRLGSAEKFLKAVLDIPLAFKRVEAMLYRANFDAEVKYLRKSFETLEEASTELKNSRLFLKLLEAVLTAGNRMNVGTNRGGAKSFKLDTLLKLVDIKGTDGKTTLLHFVVQEIIRSEGMGSVTGNLGNQTNSRGKEEEFRRQGLLVVSGLSREIGSVKLAAGMDSEVLHSYVSKLETGLQKLREVLQHERSDMQGRFFESMKSFLSKAEEEIGRIKDEERKALTLVREVTEYFHGDAAKEEAHPLRIFMIVRDFLSTLDHVCKDVGTMQERAVMGAARSFRISSNAPLPVLSRYNVRQDDSSSEESSSP